MNSGARAKLEARLRYYHDLRITSFYRDRAPSRAAPVTAGLGLPAAAAGTSATAGGAPSFVPLVAAPTLFEAAERIEGDTLEAIRAFIGDCRRCPLCQNRNSIVFGDGNPRAELVLVGEGPGADEDAQGLPFVGRAGKLLTDMIERGMGLRRSDVYICNVVKCRPPGNRLPEKDEIATCSPFLLRQLDVIKPKVIVSLGACAMQTLLGIKEGITRVHGQWFDWRGIRLMPIYHPAYLLRDPNKKPEAWRDLQEVMKFLGLPLRSKGPVR